MDESKTQTPVLAGVPLRSPFFLAPVAGYSSAAYRSVCYEQGAALCYTEMISAEALTRSHPKTEAMLARAPEEPFYSIQLFGAKPQVLARAADVASAYHPLVIDLNCGCPVPKIVKSGAGSALLKNPETIRAIVAAMKESTDIPITVKIRKGWDESSINFLETAQAAVDAGASAVTLHGRTRAQGYGGKADWSAIALLVRSLAVPVFGSGDVLSASAAIAMLEQTSCAGVMIARGAIGNPFIFADAAALWRGGQTAPRSPAQIAAVARTHLLRSIGFLGEKTACMEFRKQFCAYTKGFAGGAAMREQAVHSSTLTEFELLLDRMESNITEGPS
ncbi:MAG: tRNA dihydrouridine synthase DusB [Spirochaetaceae bacterium]|nr:tRNA dihydrouridine synthase DusB [Spirochaetaceae bacterium]